MSRKHALFAALLVSLTLPAFSVEGEAPAIPADLVDDPHVREELAVNEFTAPSIALIFESLEALSPLPINEHNRKIPEQTPMNRADLATEIGFMIADGFLVVQANELGRIEPLATELTRYGKALGAGDRVRRHAASLLESAKKGEDQRLKDELRATQRDVEMELLSLRDADLAHLISLGGWIRALDVATAAVQKQFSEERAMKVMRPDIADYYSYVLETLEPRIAERANYIEIRALLTKMKDEMTLKDQTKPTKEQINEIHSQAAKLAELALQRQNTP